MAARPAPSGWCDKGRGVPACGAAARSGALCSRRLTGHRPHAGSDGMGRPPCRRVRTTGRPACGVWQPASCSHPRAAGHSCSSRGGSRKPLQLMQLSVLRRMVIQPTRRQVIQPTRRQVIQPGQRCSRLWCSGGTQGACGTALCTLGPLQRPARTVPAGGLGPAGAPHLPSLQHAGADTAWARAHAPAQWAWGPGSRAWGARAAPPVHAMLCLQSLCVHRSHLQGLGYASCPCGISAAAVPGPSARPRRVWESGGHAGALAAPEPGI